MRLGDVEVIKAMYFHITWLMNEYVTFNSLLKRRDKGRNSFFANTHMCWLRRKRGLFATLKMLLPGGKVVFKAIDRLILCLSLQQLDDDGSLPSRPEEPEESAAEKIYATLRECREQADPKRQKGVKMQGYLLKKKEKVRGFGWCRSINRLTFRWASGSKCFSCSNKMEPILISIFMNTQR